MCLRVRPLCDTMNVRVSQSSTATTLGNRVLFFYQISRIVELSRSGAASMPLQGNIRDFSTTQLLNLVNLSRRTGMLTIFEGVPTGKEDAMKNPLMAPGAERARVAFHQGKLVFAALSGQDTGLVALLNKAGKLTDDQARLLRERAKNTRDKDLAVRLIGANP
jgi:hypothetical protein